MSRILAISDIHGHVEGVKLLLKEARYEPGSDRLFFVGDYIDKDPETWGTLAYVREQVKQGASAIIGNLEQWFLEQMQKTGNGQHQEIVKWLDSLPLYISCERYLFVHAGIRPGVPLAEQARADLLTIRKEFWQTGHTLRQKVVFGHTPTHLMGARQGEVWCQADRIGIDTGAKHRIRLTLADLTNQCAYSCSTEPLRLYQDVRVAAWPDTAKST